MRNISWIILILCLLGCASPLYVYRREGREISRIRKVAVLNFRNITDRRKAGKIITNLFVQELFNSNLYGVEEIGNVREFLVRHRIRESGEIDVGTLEMMGAQLGVDALVMGTVEEYYQDAGTREGMSPRFSLSVRMIDTRTGKILWKCRGRRSGDDSIILLDWGKVRTVISLAQKVIREMIATLG